MSAMAQTQNPNLPPQNTIMHSPLPSSTAAAAANANANKLWAWAHTLSATLLHDSLPCMKRSKRPVVPSAPQSTNQQQPPLPRQRMQPLSPVSECGKGDQVDVAACINVLFGTLLKLYQLGAKTPTFKARVAMTTRYGQRFAYCIQTSTKSPLTVLFGSRLMDLSTLPIAEQNAFLAEHASLVRLCFMEYSLNALVDWLPCERELLLRTCPAMDTYLRIAGSMCDIFRQDALATGLESWELLNRAAATSIERCIRVCKFKVIF